MFINELFDKILSKYPITLIDIGASGGLESPWNLIPSNLKVIGFEPDKEAFDQLLKTRQKTGIKQRYLNTALYQENTPVNFYLTRKREHSSIFEPNDEIIKRFSFPERYDVLETRKIATNRLDEALAKTGILDVDFIKLDSQGSELSILQGGEKTMAGCFGVEVEVEFLPIYQNQPLFSELEIFLRSLGFELFDIKRHYEKRGKYRDINQAKGQLVCGDALFLKGVRGFISDVATGDEERVKAKILKSIAICYLYRLIDYALAITEEAFNRHYLSKEEREVTVQKLRLAVSAGSRFSQIINLVKALASESFRYAKSEKIRGSYNDSTLGNIRR